MSDSSSALESLLLLQSVATHGATQQAFTRISEALRSSDLLREATSLSDDRFNARTLTDTYLTLLKAEAKSTIRNASSTPSTKPASPTLATVEDAKPHFHLVSGMIPKLYEEYKGRLIRDIRDEERRYDQLTRELKEAQSKAQQEEKVQRSSEIPATRPSSSDKGKLDTILNQEDELPAHHSYPRPAPGSPFLARATSRTSHSPQADRQQPYNFYPTNPPLAPSPTRHDTSYAKQSSSSPVILPPPTGGFRRPPVPTGSAQWTGQYPHSPPRPPDPTHEQQKPGSGSYRPIHSALPEQPQIPRWMQSPYQTQQSSASPATYRQTSPQYPVQPSSSQQQIPNNGQTVHSADRPYASHLPQPQHSDPNTSTPGASFASGPRRISTAAPHASLSVANLLNDQPAIHFSPGSSTGWRGQYPPKRERPSSRSVSPVSDQGKVTVMAAPKRSTRRNRPNGLQLSRDGQSSSARRGSKTPSVPNTSTSQGRTRSQSVASFGDDTSMASGPSNRRGATSSLHTPTPGDIPPTRHTGSKPSVTASAKRKRRDSTAESFVTAEALPSPALPQPPQQPPDTIMATRNFQRITGPLMENIASHKFASIFANPVRQTTKGYYDNIRRPTDLKTIRGQIVQGTKAVAAAAATNTAGSSGSDSTEPGSVVPLPYSEELEPPNAIVNADQLEQELMRMFANAVMFNEGDHEGVVASTRQMSADVEKVLDDFKGAEGRSYMMGWDDGGNAKRRRA